MKKSFYDVSELKDLKFKSIGKNVLISKYASFYYPETIELGNNVRIDDFCIISGQIKIGNNIHIAAYSAFYGKFGIELEDFSGISPGCIFLSANDDFSGHFLVGPTLPDDYTNVTGGKILVKKFSVIGTQSIVMPGVTIHEGVAVGARSLIKKDLPAWGIYAGNPIRFLKNRDKGLLDLYSKYLKNY